MKQLLKAIGKVVQFRRRIVGHTKSYLPRYEISKRELKSKARGSSGLSTSGVQGRAAQVPSRVQVLGLFNPAAADPWLVKQCPHVTAPSI